MGAKFDAPVPICNSLGAMKRNNYPPQLAAVFLLTVMMPEAFAQPKLVIPNDRGLGEILFPESRAWTKITDIKLLLRSALTPELRAHLSEHSSQCYQPALSDPAWPPEGTLHTGDILGPGDDDILYVGNDIFCTKTLGVTESLIWRHVHNPEKITVSGTVGLVLRIEFGGQNRFTAFEPALPASYPEINEPIEQYKTGTIRDDQPSWPAAALSIGAAVPGPAAALALTIPKTVTVDSGRLVLQHAVALRWAPREPNQADQAAFGYLQTQSIDLNRLNIEAGTSLIKLLKTTGEDGKPWLLVKQDNRNLQRARKFFSAAWINRTDPPTHHIRTQEDLRFPKTDISDTLFPESTGWRRVDSLPVLRPQSLPAPIRNRMRTLVGFCNQTPDQAKNWPSTSTTIRYRDILGPGDDDAVSTLPTGCQESDTTFIWRNIHNPARMSTIRVNGNLVRIDANPPNHFTLDIPGCCADSIESYQVGDRFPEPQNEFRLFGRHLGVPKNAIGYYQSQHLAHAAEFYWAPSNLPPWPYSASGTLPAGTAIQTLLRSKDETGHIWTLIKADEILQDVGQFPVTAGWIRE